MIERKRLFIIFLGLLLMISAIIIIDLSLNAEAEEAEVGSVVLDEVRELPKESGVFRRSGTVKAYEMMPDTSTRTLEEYYDNRAYYGAPPVVPHPILTEGIVGGDGCLQCHEDGGYVSEFKAYAPVTPHPDFLNCVQCHVPQNTDELFKETEWYKMPPPKAKITALAGSPPLIPHSLHMRENCLSCHAGPAAPKEIRVSHPMRVNCRQCHAQADVFDEGLIEWKRSYDYVKKESNE